MSLAALSREEKAELVALGMNEQDLYFVESLIAKKQVVLLQEMLARGRTVDRLPSVIKDEQRSLMRNARLLVLAVKPVKIGSWKSAYILAYWRHKDSRKIVREIL